jgi:hypothetical protein
MTTKRRSSVKKRLGRSVSKKFTFASASAAAKFVIAKGLALPLTETAVPVLKAEAGAPILIITGPKSISIKAGSKIGGCTFKKATPAKMPSAGLEIGADYGITLMGKTLVAKKLISAPGKGVFAGFHFAPGGNAAADRGGDDKPAINPCSVWDTNFRPKCCNPCGMAFVESGKFWVDIYLLAADHLAEGTSRYGVTIADGNDLPEDPKGGRFARCDYAAVSAVMAHHGKGLLAPEEFYTMATGVTERSSAKDDPCVTGLDAARTSKFGVMQATGNLWAWGHDGTKQKWASVFGGSWWGGGDAGSRCAHVACNWPDYSSESIGARGRSDHLQPA